MRYTLLICTCLASLGCSDDDPEATGFPTGTYGVTIEASEVATLPQAAQDELIGSWSITWGTDTYTVSKGGAQLITGHFSTNGNNLTINSKLDESGPAACENAATESASYTFSVSTDLILTPVSDSCIGRKTVLSLKALTQQ